MAAHPAGKGRDNQPGMASLLDELCAQAPYDEVVNEFWAATSEIYIELQDVLLSKQADYGPRAINEAPGGALPGVLVRLHDKWQRLLHLQQVGIEPQHETVRDTYLDLANYAVISLMLIDGTWPRG